MAPEHLVYKMEIDTSIIDRQMKSIPEAVKALEEPGVDTTLTLTYAWRQEQHEDRVVMVPYFSHLGVEWEP